MYDHHLREMAEAIFGRHGDPRIIDGTISILRKYWKDYAVHVWSVPDVEGMAGQIGIPMSKWGARAVLASVEEHIDCEWGVHWDTIKGAIEQWWSALELHDLSPDELEELKGNYLLVISHEKHKNRAWFPGWGFRKVSEYGKERADRSTPDDPIVVRMFSMPVPPDTDPADPEEFDGNTLDEKNGILVWEMPDGTETG